ncbi:hypothetical protein EP7_001931 [Isosphaeraceae bacterium EP7]
MSVAYDPNSLVDALRSMGYGSSFAARRRLWGLYDLREAYTGSARQNGLLLAAVKLGQRAPTLRLTRMLYDIGQDVDAVVVADAKVLIENAFGGQSLEAVPGQTVRLGKVNYAGVFPVRVASGFLATQGALMVLPHTSGRIAVGYVATPVESTAVPVPLPTNSNDANLLEKFYDAVNEARLKSAWDATWGDVWKPDRVAGMTLDVFFAVLLLLVPGVGEARIVTMGWTASGWVFDTLHDFTDKLAEEVPGLDDSERTRLKILLATPTASLKFGLDVGRFRADRTLCSLYDLLGTSADNFFLKTFELEPSGNENLKLAGSMLRDATNKSIGFVCEVVKK